MSQLQTWSTSSEARQSRTVLVSFLGAIVRRMGYWMPISGVVELLRQYGIDESSIRTAVFRLKKRGWLHPESVGGAKGYRLTPLALEELASGDALIWHARRPAELGDGWCLVNFSVPESVRAIRHQLRAHLAALGFGNIGAAVWIAPARALPAAKKAISELGLDKHCAIFVGDYAGTQDLSDVVQAGWDLDEIDARYKYFIEVHGARADQFDNVADLDPQIAFVEYLAVIDHWRKLPFRDPGLPLELVGDMWTAPAAAALFERLVARLEGRALAHAASHWPRHDRLD